MKDKSGNYQDNIHNEAYRERYASPLLNCGGVICDAGRPRESLDGEWNFCIDQYDSFLRAQWYKEEKRDASGRELPVDYDFDDWEKVPVPSCWNTLRPEYLCYEGPAVYTRTFKYRNRGEKRVYLKLGAANYEAFLFLNGKFVGRHMGGSTPFYAEVSKFLQTDNRVSVVVDNTRSAGHVPAKNTDWHNYGGLYRSVELIRLPETFISDFTVGLSKDDDKAVSVGVTLNEKIDCSATVAIPELSVKRRVEVRGGSWNGSLSCAPQLWSPECPRLYRVEIACCGDLVSDEVGFRRIEARGADVYLNGEKVFLKGVSVHEESEKNGKALKEEEIFAHLAAAKELGCNYVRLAHYPHSEKAAKLADRIGIMLWEEIPVYWAIDFESAKVLYDAKNQLGELIRRDKNRASVIIWSVGNENADTDARLEFMSALVSDARGKDPSRLVAAACLVDLEACAMADRLAGYLDIIGINEYFGWYDPDFSKLGRLFENSGIKKPVVISEFGADALSGCHGTVDDLFTEEKQADVYEKQVEVLEKAECVKGMSPWILYDFRCPRRHNRFQQGYNLKGLISADGSYKKAAYFVLKNFYAKR